MKQFKPFFPLLIFLILFSNALATKPRIQTHSTFSQFQRGTLENISILYDGKLSLAPQKTLLMDTGDPFVWDIVIDKKGNIYLATGNDGRVYKISAKKDSSIFFDAPELEVYALALDNNDNLYAATSPNGKVYKVSPSGDSSVVFDPEDKYIWDLVINAQNELFVATGDKGAIYRVLPDGTSKVVFQSKQKHIRCLALAANGQLFAGSSGNGYVYKFIDDFQPFVLFDTQMEEVHSLTITPSGLVFAAAFGEPSVTVAALPAKKTSKSSTSGVSQGQSGQKGDEVSLTPQSIIPESIARATKTKTSLFRIDKNGYAKDLWLDNDEYIQVLLFDQGNDILVGTGNKGKLFKINSDGQTSLVLDAEESQITTLYRTSAGTVYIGTSNMGRCYQLSTKSAARGSFISETIDAGALSEWGVLNWEGTVKSGQIKFYTRSGNTERPSETWSTWKPVRKNSDQIYEILSPVARFIQWKCELQGANGEDEYVKKVSVSYLQNNLPPEVTAVVIHKPGDYYNVSENSGSSITKQGQKKSGLVYPQPLTKSEYKKGYRSVDWMFEDPNFDALRFDLYYRRVGSKRWKTFAKDLQSSVYSWDSAQMMDGEYEIKVVATDAPSNPASLALTGEKKSDPFIIDNTAPTIKDLRVRRNGSNWVLSFVVQDEWSRISRLEYSLDADSWQILYPTDDICDSKVEHFEITIPGSRPVPIEVAIKAFDEIENVTVTYKEIKGRK